MKNGKMPASMLNGCVKLVPDLKARTQGLHIAHLKLLIELGALVTRVHRIWSFKQGRVLKDFIHDMAARRRDAPDEASKASLKLIVNSIYGKFLERKERGRQIRVHTNLARCRRAALKKTCNMHVKMQMLKKLPTGETSFLGITAHAVRKPIVLDTPRIVGWTVLEYARRHMYNFYYNVLKKIFGDMLEIGYTDTDSIHFRIKWPTDPAEEMHKWNVQCLKDTTPPVFDLSEFERFKESCRPFAGTVGLFKHEQGDAPMVEAAYTASKMYAYRCEENFKDVDTLKGKGVPADALVRTYKTLEAYKEAILENNAPPAKCYAMQSKDHIMQHKIVTKACLTADNDKVFLLSPYASRPLGHCRNNLQESQEGWADHELEADRLLRAMVFTPVDETKNELVDSDAEDSIRESESDSESECVDAEGDESLSDLLDMLND